MVLLKFLMITDETMLSGNFKEGYAEGKWKIYHWESLADDCIESEWN